ncbi:hypothetical protein RKE29_11180 [Streptomyces sp. B1866]|uniref:hypothetical protein n=1 Tax=Streptomyces sp. B1866 TaxID=3075431 RepID=UPI00288D7A6C|nr:hypothetical protein [Streptomyces sp. B1866]MDT3397202.1 hypothetical protein [Streptomyces sp. B1866]
MTASLGFYATRATSVRLHVYGTTRAPILQLDGSDHSLAITAFDSLPVADHLAFARALAAATADYLTALLTYAAAVADDDTADAR